ncbi:MAG TPA: type VI secretion system tube protein Hcp [Bosea sp. (in: a-proteobacteria)]
MTIWAEFSSPIGKYFEALAASSGMGVRPTAGGARGKAQYGDFQLTKRTDNLSPMLVQHCARGTAFALVTLEFYNKADILQLTYQLTNVIITSFQSGGRGDGVPTESLSLNAESMSYEYYRPSPGP